MDIIDIRKKMLEARIAHIRWVHKAEALVGGLPLDKNQVPLLATDCDFGQWYLNEGRVLRQLPSYQSVSIHHEQLHHIYMEIFKLIFSDEERLNIFQWLGIQRQISDDKQEKARALIPRLKQASHEVLACLDQLESEFEKAVKPQDIHAHKLSDDLEKLSKELKAMGYTGRSST